VELPTGLNKIGKRQSKVRTKMKYGRAGELLLKVGSTYDLLSGGANGNSWHRR